MAGLSRPGGLGMRSAMGRVGRADEFCRACGSSKGSPGFEPVVIARGEAVVILRPFHCAACHKFSVTVGGNDRVACAGVLAELDEMRLEAGASALLEAGGSRPS